MDHLASIVSSALSLDDGTGDRGTETASIPLPGPFKNWPDEQKSKDNIPDLLPYTDERAKLLVHIISPDWVSDPDLYTESKFTREAIKLDKVDKADITKVRCSV